MCYEAKAQLRRQIKEAEHMGHYHEADELKRKLADLEQQFDDSGLENYFYWTLGFAHPEMFIYTNHDPTTPTLATWGLIPSHMETKDEALDIRNKTINARSETMFSKPSFAHSAEHNRCVVYFEGFYEYYHQKIEGKKVYKRFPYLISLKSGRQMPIAGLYSTWQDLETGFDMTTFTIVTTKANDLLTKIHNNPNLKFGPRMPVILPIDKIHKWLSPNPAYTKSERDTLLNICTPLSDDLFEAHTVGQLKGKEGLGNTQKATEKHDYPDLRKHL